jgi:5-methylcytosine-specific restriction endonuclease McrA
MRDADLHEWFGQHADHSGLGRSRVLGHKRDPKVYEHGDPPTLLTMKVFKRDGYRCRYCGLRVILPEVLKTFSAVIGKDVFPYETPASERHGATRVYPASPDHVIPKGLLENPHTKENLVTACWPCQFGKMEFRLEQLGLVNPFDRDPIRDDWDGLTSALRELKAQL